MDRCSCSTPFRLSVKCKPYWSSFHLPLSPIPKLVLSPDPDVPEPCALYPNPKLVPPFLKILPPPPLKSSPAPAFLNVPNPRADVIYGVADSSGSGAPYSTCSGSFPCLSKASVILAFLSHLVELFTRYPKFCILRKEQIRLSYEISSFASFRSFSAFTILFIFIYSAIE